MVYGPALNREKAAIAACAASRKSPDPLECTPAINMICIVRNYKLRRYTLLVLYFLRYLLCNLHYSTCISIVRRSCLISLDGELYFQNPRKLIFTSDSGTLNAIETHFIYGKINCLKNVANDLVVIERYGIRSWKYIPSCKIK